MFELEVKYQNSYSRLQLLARSFLGIIYIVIPHFFALLFMILWAKLLWLYATFYILLKGKYPKNVFEYQLGLLRWLARLHIAVYNLADEYPAFGINKEEEYLKLEITYNETPDRLWVLLRFILLPVLILPHSIAWLFRNLISIIFAIAAFFVVLVTGKYPQKMFDFNIGTLRWIMRVMAYFTYLTEDYPPFTGKTE